MIFEWESIAGKIFSQSEANLTMRAKVFGGWIVNHIVWVAKDKTQSESMVFIPDPSHQWNINPKEDMTIGELLEWARDTRFGEQLNALVREGKLA